MSEVVKIVVVGDSDVGKTSIVSRYVTGNFSSEQNATVGAGFLSKTLAVKGQSLRLNIWDTAGQERFRALAQLFYRNAQAIVVVYDVTDADSLDKLQVWQEEVREKGPKQAILAIVGNKEDLIANEAVDVAEVKAYAKSLGALYMRTSALADTGINELFAALATQYVATQLPPSMNDSFVVPDGARPNKRFCC